jgi:chorismate mutase
METDMTVRAARGAIKVAEDTSPCVLAATERLVDSMLERNEATGDDLISMLFTVTDDISSVFPAEAARRMGLGLVPLMCAREIPVAGSMPLVVRVLMHLHTDRSQNEMEAVYLDGAESLRDDLT